MYAKGEAQRQGLVDAANRLIYQRGYARTSFSDIAKEAGFNRGNFYHYFKAKEDILAAVVADRLGRIQGMLDGWDADIDAPLERLHRFVRILSVEAEDVAKSGCPMGTLSSEMAKGDRGNLALVRQMFDLFRVWLERQFTLLGIPAEQAPAHATRLLVLTQGIAMLAHVYGDAEILKSEVRDVENWLKTLEK
ncbi:MAG TPA: TetR/AcrR family transcriptional regulator [Aliiroseovarius sp.]|nr:TetR/AcrR family transcriptional regulator [Aliiroseovarius sp.]